MTSHTSPLPFAGPEGQDDMPFLLTPGPLTTKPSVRHAMLADWGSRDKEFIAMVSDIRRRLLAIAGDDGSHECVLMQGSGSFAIEAALGAFAPRGRKRKVLVINNGAYGRRAGAILDRLVRPRSELFRPETLAPNARNLRDALKADPDITLVFAVHCETTTGIVNPIGELAAVAREFDKTVMVDAMSSFGALPLDMEEDGIDIMVSSANKCIEGVPGFAYAICRRDMLEASAGNSHSVVLDLYEQWRAMEANGQFRFTPPTHALAAFHTALQEFDAEGGRAARLARYQRNAELVHGGLAELGFVPLLEDRWAGPIIQTFRAPADPNYRFSAFYDELRARGFAIYPGKLTQAPTFRVGTIGQIDEAIVHRFIDAVRDTMKTLAIRSGAPK